MASIYKPTYYKTDAKTGRKEKRRLRKWYVRYKDAEGRSHTVPGYTDKTATKQLAARLERTVARRQEGIIDNEDAEQMRPLAEHVEDFRRYLAAKGNGAQHVTRTIRYVETILNACRFTRIAEIQPSAVVEFLAKQREPSGGALIDQDQDRFTAQEVAALFGVTVDSVHRMVKRGQLNCQGVRRQKRFLREDVQVALRARSRGIGIETSNHYLVAIKEFTRWLVRDLRTMVNPLAHLSRLNADVDVRHPRRALTEEAFNRFVDATATGKAFRGLTGPDRLVLYLLAAQTGFRAKELASLEPASFALDVRPPTVEVAAAYSKHRRADIQPLRQDVAEVIRQYSNGKPSGAKLWPGTWVRAAAEMVRMDLDSAGIDYQDDSGRYFDFHAIRGQFISFLAARGVHPKVAQVLARHSTITLTMDFYTHVDVLDISGALENLPTLPGSTKVGKEKAAG